MEEIKILAPAKINLYLNVLRRLSNGYHAIDTVMQAVSLCDTIILRPRAAGIKISCSKQFVTNPMDNIAFKAAALFLQVRPNLKVGADITIEKNIPVSAGLAGGSTDAAAVLIGLNLLYGAGLNENELCSMGLALGADVPFCIMGGIQRARGIGELLTPLPELPDCELLIAVGDESISTKWAYEQIDHAEINHSHKNDVAEALCGTVPENIRLKNICAGLYNSFETLIDFSGTGGAAGIKKVMESSGALGTLMSGSGPSVFGIFNNVRQRDVAALTLNALGYRVYPCKAIN